MASEQGVPLAVELTGIVKRFPGVIANDGVNLTIARGEIHCLLGENGAGKTTLMRILYGLYQPDEGHIALHGKTVRITSPKAALSHRIGMVHQHFHLVPTLSVEENIVLGLSEGTGPFLNLKKTRKKLRRLAEEYGLQVDPGAKVWQLSVGQQQRVEILKALYRDADILIMDEPTSVLTPQEVDGLFGTLRTFVEAGLTVIFITHKLDEVMEVSHRVTVLRKGKAVATVDTAASSKAGLARLMVGREVIFRVEKTPPQLGERILHVEDLHARNDRGLPALRGMSFDLYAGEILGVAGVSGNGQHELSEVLTGLRKATRGKATFEAHDLTECSARTIADLGVAHVPTERIRVGTVPAMSIRENLILKSYRSADFCKWLILDEKAAYENACKAMKEYEISAPHDGTAVGNLSGGNIQRLVLARELCGSPKFVVAAHPTYGLDVGATEQVRRVLLEQRDRGAGILLISEDLDEILQLSDRILVIYEGQIMGIVPAEGADLGQIGLMMAGSHRQEVSL
ncbi:MAG: ABC transporter ATP-binding protein [Candidatus Atribacteria bacterium]|nr:MAG: ABC transporter ATP-binding protein [Candidatus Atribacteria bacterium]